MRRQRAAPKELKALGPHPVSGEPVRILDGRYGPYVTDGTTNASLPKGLAVEGVTMAQAQELLAARAGAAKGGRARKAKAPARRKKSA
jgi:DNA topoisomerase-1